MKATRTTDSSRRSIKDVGKQLTPLELPHKSCWSIPTLSGLKKYTSSELKAHHASPVCVQTGDKVPPSAESCFTAVYQ